jgi:hypothetical protein
MFKTLKMIRLKYTIAFVLVLSCNIFTLKAQMRKVFLDTITTDNYIRKIVL